MDILQEYDFFLLKIDFSWDVCRVLLLYIIMARKKKESRYFKSQTEHVFSFSPVIFLLYQIQMAV